MTREPADPRLQVAFVGAGAIARFLATRIDPAVASVTMLVRRDAQRHMLADTGIRAEGPGGTFTARAQAFLSSEIPPDRRFDALFVCVKSGQTRAALEPCLGNLSRTAPIISAQNGLNDAVLAETVERARAFGMVLSVPCQAVGECDVRYLTERPGAILGALSPRGMPRLPAIGDLFGDRMDISVTDNLAGARWSKLAVNCASGPLLALSGLSLGGLANHVDLRRCAVGVVQEVLSVADRCGAAPVAVLGLGVKDWVGDGARGEEAISSFGRSNPTGRSSLATDYDRGARTEIDDLLGAVIRAGEGHGVPTPLCRRLLAVFSERAAGALPRKPIPADELARNVMEETHDPG